MTARRQLVIRLTMNTMTDTANSSARDCVAAHGNEEARWFAVRPALLIVLAILTGLLGAIIGCPTLIDQALIAVL